MTSCFVRLTLHRDAITMIKYLPTVKIFVTTCTGNYFKVWRCHDQWKKQQVLCDFKIPKATQAIKILHQKYATTIDRFLVIFTTGESELFEFDSETDSLYWIESEKSREHDRQITGHDYNRALQLIVTSDTNGSVRIWTREKRFLREIQFPSRVDCVCFLNAKGDLLVSHAKRISLIKFTTYWTKVFDYYGITCSKEDEDLY
jgi:WD40 repeat protein